MAAPKKNLVNKLSAVCKSEVRALGRSGGNNLGTGNDVGLGLLNLLQNIGGDVVAGGGVADSANR